MLGRPSSLEVPSVAELVMKAKVGQPAVTEALEAMRAAEAQV
jgi:hypothetical protein